MRAVGGLGLVLALAAPAAAQVPCVRLDSAFSCADGTSLPIYDNPWGRGGRARGGGAGGGIGLGEPDALRAGTGGWWKDDRSVRGPDGEVCLRHGNHVHCGGSITDGP
ncbi:MAG TPA: hypothetical protein VEA38_00060 [Terriglobales bacterium]|nr:hypothetical protein [Terriglobales bacterium]